MRNSLKMSNKKLKRIIFPIMVLVLALVLTVSIRMHTNSAALDTFFGKGQKTVVTLDATAWDANYYPQLYASIRDAQSAATVVSKKISDEGIVLLKNDGLLPLSQTEQISPFGLRYYYPFYGGKGSSAIDTNGTHIVTPQQGLYKVFGGINAVIEEKMTQASTINQDLANNSNVVSANPLHSVNNTINIVSSIYEFNVNIYSGAEDSCKGTIGVVFIGRQTGENCDAYPGVYDDETEHMLALTATEKETIKFAKTHCSSVIVVLESSSPMQIVELHDDEEISAILWVGGAGSSGYESLGDILVGNKVPSGRTPDIYPVDFKKDPTFANHDDGTDSFVYSNAYTTLVSNYSWTDDANAPFHEYEEGVYLGYKYYETAYDISYLSDYYNRTDGVLYPFGYGLSYTTFSQQIITFSDDGDKISMAIRIKNEGTEYAGKEVVQVYFSAPYTEFDRSHRIEKPTAVLIRFEKTSLIAPGDYEDVAISFSKEDMASYCYVRNNEDGTVGCYVLEEGEYNISIRANSHDILGAKTTRVPSTVWYDNKNPRQAEINAQSALDDSGNLLGYSTKSAIGESAYQAASNQFEQINTYMTDPTVSSVTILSRKDWAGTQPTPPTAVDRSASNTVISWISMSDTTSYDYSLDNRLGNESGSLIYQEKKPLIGADNGLVLTDLRGKSYYDPMWDMLLAQLTFTDVEEIRLCLFENAYQTGAIISIGKPKSSEYDGPQGLTHPDQLGHNWLNGTCGYPSAPVMAATWNKELMYEFGYMVGQEALVMNINGWYAPGLNTHRSPFGGRIAEYFSEDGVLSGYLGAQVISGAGDAGTYCSVKHLALIDTEGHRNPHTTQWLTEQALREIYLKPFEIALNSSTKTIRYIANEKGTLESKTMRAGNFIMTGDCAIGTYWTSTNYELLTQVVRGEWGFQGCIISDMNLKSNDNRIDMMLRAGCDALMSTSYGWKANAQDYTSATGLNLIRNAIKNVCYTNVNSNLMQGAAPGSTIRYSMSPWTVWLIIVNTVAGLLITATGIWIVLRGRDEKKNPEKYTD